jgi:hypothetical protein
MSAMRMAASSYSRSRCGSYQLRDAKAGQAPARVLGKAQHGQLRGAVIALQRDRDGALRKLLREVEDVVHGGAAERVDGLGIVADHHHAGAVRLHAAQDAGLQAVRVLVFVDQQVVEQRPQFRAQFRVARHLGTEQQQVVVVEDVLFLLGVDVGGEQTLELRFPFRAPGKRDLQHLGQRRAAVHRPRIDRQAGRFQRKALLAGRAAQTDILAHHARQVFGIGAVVNRERRLQADASRIFAQQARANAVEGARPRQPHQRRGRSAEQTLQHGGGALAKGFVPVSERKPSGLARYPQKL